MRAAPQRSRTEWWSRLARTLGLCPALLQKAARFARLYPSTADLAALGRLRVDWTRASLALVIGEGGCHAPHGPAYTGLLKAPAKKLCASCHDW